MEPGSVRSLLQGAYTIGLAILKTTNFDAKILVCSLKQHFNTEPKQIDFIFSQIKTVEMLRGTLLLRREMYTSQGELHQ